MPTFLCPATASQKTKSLCCQRYSFEMSSALTASHRKPTTTTNYPCLLLLFAIYSFIYLLTSLQYKKWEAIKWLGMEAVTYFLVIPDSFLNTIGTAMCQKLFLITQILHFLIAIFSCTIPPQRVFVMLLSNHRLRNRCVFLDCPNRKEDEKEKEVELMLQQSQSDAHHPIT